VPHPTAAAAAAANAEDATGQLTPASSSGACSSAYACRASGREKSGKTVEPGQTRPTWGVPSLGSSSNRRSSSVRYAW
jgi:hypothetical protein